MALEIATRGDGERDIVSLTGELDLLTAQRFTDCARMLHAAGRYRLIIDLAALSFCDSTGISAFVVTYKECLARDGYLRLAAPHGPVARVLLLVGLVEIVPTYRTLRAALTADPAGRVTPEP